MAVHNRKWFRPTAEDRRSFPRYLVTGLGLYAVDFLTFAALAVGLNIHVAASQFAARAVGAAVGFVAHRHYTFRDNTRAPEFGLATQGGGYLIVSVVTLALSPLLILGAMELTGGHKIFAKLLTEPFIVAIAYVGLRAVFRAKSR